MAHSISLTPAAASGESKPLLVAHDLQRAPHGPRGRDPRRRDADGTAAQGRDPAKRGSRGAGPAPAVAAPTGDGAVDGTKDAKAGRDRLDAELQERLWALFDAAKALTGGQQTVENWMALYQAVAEVPEGQRP